MCYIMDGVSVMNMEGMQGAWAIPVSQCFELCWIGYGENNRIGYHLYSKDSLNIKWNQCLVVPNKIVYLCS